MPPVAGDPAALRELLTNLVLNAVDALPHGGRITVETRVDGAAVVLAVGDTGVGMSDEVRRRAHEPFFTTKGVKATGLGLSVAYGIARRHGGELTIASAEGGGTTVVVQLPPATRIRAPATTPARRRPLRILLVDDEDEVRHALGEMLASEGHTVVMAGSGADALRRLEADDAIDVLLTDLVMPGMTGWELADAVKARHARLAVGVLTGWGDLPDTGAAEPRGRRLRPRQADHPRDSCRCAGAHRLTSGAPGDPGRSSTTAATRPGTRGAERRRRRARPSGPRT